MELCRLVIIEVSLKIAILCFCLQIFFFSQAAEFVISIGGALVFCGFILFDTHVLMHKLSPEEYILASINLYPRLY